MAIIVIIIMLLNQHLQIPIYSCRIFTFLLMMVGIADDIVILSGIQQRLEMGVVLLEGMIICTSGGVVLRGLWGGVVGVVDDLRVDWLLLFIDWRGREVVW